MSFDRERPRRMTDVAWRRVLGTGEIASTPDALVGTGEAETRMVSAGRCREAVA